MTVTLFMQLEGIFNLIYFVCNHVSPCLTIFCRYEVKRSGYIIVTNANEEEDVLNPAVLSAAMHLWSVIQAMTVETDQVKLTYPSICVKFPIPLEFGDVLGVVLAQNNKYDIRVNIYPDLVKRFV